MISPKHKIKLALAFVSFLIILIGLFFFYRSIKIDEQANLIVKHHHHHMGEFRNETKDIDLILRKGLEPDNQDSDHDHHHEQEQVHEKEHSHNNGNVRDFAHVEWVNRPYNNPIYNRNLLLKISFLVIVIALFFIYTYLIDKAKTYSEPEQHEEN